jgi:hypothetical protein
MKRIYDSVNDLQDEAGTPLNIYFIKPVDIKVSDRIHSIWCRYRSRAVLLLVVGHAH